MVDLKSQYLKIKDEINDEIQDVLDSTRFIGGPKVESFANNLASYLGADHVITCANGTDALQIALMSLNLKPDDEVIVPAFTYVATAEVICLLGLKPVMIDVEYGTFNINKKLVEDAITPNTKAIIIVHLFGQSTDMDDILVLAKERGIYTIEDNAQSIGAVYNSNVSGQKKTGTMATIGTTSFYPSKNLGCYGDGGAMCTNDQDIAEKLKMIANHGQSKRYYHDLVGCNSRLDALQAAILNVKLKHLDEYSKTRQRIASEYDAAFQEIEGIEIPKRLTNSTHVFNQYNLKVHGDRRDQLLKHLNSAKIPTMIYYPLPLYKQKAFKKHWVEEELPVTEKLCKEVLAIPMHSEIRDDQLTYIINSVKSFFN